MADKFAVGDRVASLVHYPMVHGVVRKFLDGEVVEVEWEDGVRSTFHQDNLAPDPYAVD